MRNSFSGNGQIQVKVLAGIRCNPEILCFNTGIPSPTRLTVAIDERDSKLLIFTKTTTVCFGSASQAVLTVPVCLPTANRICCMAPTMHGDPIQNGQRQPW